MKKRKLTVKLKPTRTLSREASREINEKEEQANDLSLVTAGPVVEYQTATVTRKSQTKLKSSSSASCRSKPRITQNAGSALG